jgi:hypothetical protein
MCVVTKFKSIVVNLSVISFRSPCKTSKLGVLPFKCFDSNAYVTRNLRVTKVVVHESNILHMTECSVIWRGKERSPVMQSGDAQEVL